MRKSLCALLALAGSFPALAAERQYSVTDFDTVEVDGPYQVALTTGRTTAARASGSAAALDRLQIDVQGGTLRVRNNPSAWGGYPGADAGTPATVVLATRDLRAARINGSGKLTIDKARAMRLTLTVSGSGAILLPDVQADTLAAGLIGSGRMELGGKVKSFRAEVHGSADLDAAGLTADDAQVVADTAGNVRLAALRSANVAASATGDVAVTGPAACTVKQNGTGSVRCGRN